MICEIKYSDQIKRDKLSTASTIQQLLILLHTNRNMQALLIARKHSVSKRAGVAKEGIGIHLYKIHYTYAFNPLTLPPLPLPIIQFKEGYFIFQTSLYKLNCVTVVPLSDKHPQHRAKEISTLNLLRCVKNKGFIQGP